MKIEKVEAPATAQPEEVELHPERESGAGLLGTAAAAAKGAARAVGQAAKAAVGAGPRAHIADYIGLLHASEERLAKAFDQDKATHPKTPDVGPAGSTGTPPAARRLAANVARVVCWATGPRVARKTGAVTGSSRSASNAAP